MKSLQNIIVLIKKVSNPIFGRAGIPGGKLIRQNNPVIRYGWVFGLVRYIIKV
jgi:hypothetical protein